MPEVSYLTSKEVASVLGVSQRTVSRRVKKGELKCQKRKGKLFFPKEQFQDTEKQEKVDGTLQSVLGTLQKQLDEKDSQIQTLTKLVENQQILTKDLQEKLLLLPEFSQKPDRKQETEKKPKPKKKPRKKPKTVKKEPEKEKGFWEEIFG